MDGTFLPWKARTEEVVGVMEESVEFGMLRCKFSCCRSLVVVIFVRRPATISIISVMGMAEISYLRSSLLRRLEAKLWICARSRTLIVRPVYFGLELRDWTERETVMFEVLLEVGEESAVRACR